MDHSGLKKLDELGTNIDDLKEAHQKLANFISEPTPVSQSMLEVQEMVQKITESHQETQEEMRRIARSISSVETAVTRLTGGSAATSISVSGWTTSPGSLKAPTQLGPAIKDNEDEGYNHARRRRRTGPLSAEQRKKAAVIRKIGPCQDCRRRRVAVSNPQFFCNMCWISDQNAMVVSPKTSRTYMGRSREQIQRLLTLGFRSRRRS